MKIGNVRQYGILILIVVVTVVILEFITISVFYDVAKIDLAKNRAPFIEAGLIATGLAIVIIAVGMTLFAGVRKAMLRQTSESEERFAALIKHSHSLIYIKDLDGRFRLVNPAFEEWTDIAAEDAYGRTVHELFPTVATGVDAVERAVIETGEPVDEKFELPRGDGAMRTVLTTKFPISKANGDIGAVGTISVDITEHIAFEERLRQSQKLEAIGQLTGGVAHDFNNMLGVIIGNLDLLADKLQDNAGLLALVESATKAALNGANLNRQLLAFSRQQSLSPRVIDLNDNVSAMSDMLRRTLGETIEFVVKQSDGLWAADVDPTQVESALLNLAVNARDAMPEGGKLTIETANVRLDDDYAAAQAEVKPGEYVMLALTDTGAGMTPEVLRRVFEPFFTTKEVGRGTGLGLSMVFGFAKQSGGHVTLRSEVGQGTTVKLYLPRVQRPAETVAEETEEIPMAQGETVLVVEDDPELRRLVVEMLIDLGYKVLEAGNVETALQAMTHTSRINLLLTDVVLPGGKGGPEIAAEAGRRLPDIKVLFMSGYPRDITTQQGRLDDGVLLLEKPFRKAGFACKLREALAA